MFRSKYIHEAEDANKACAELKLRNKGENPGIWVPSLEYLLEGNHRAPVAPQQPRKEESTGGENEAPPHPQPSPRALNLAWTTHGLQQWWHWRSGLPPGVFTRCPGQVWSIKPQARGGLRCQTWGGPIPSSSSSSGPPGSFPPLSLWGGNFPSPGASGPAPPRPFGRELLGWVFFVCLFLVGSGERTGWRQLAREQL